MTQITVTLTKETPLETMLDAVDFITRAANRLYPSTVLAPAAPVVAATEVASKVVLEPKVAPVGPAPEPMPIAVENNPHELDVDGYPWDERIHASGRSKTAGGQWRKRRGTAPARVAQVEAELRNKIASIAVAANPTLTVTPAPLTVPPPPAASGPLPPPPEPSFVPPAPAQTILTATIAAPPATPPTPATPTGRSFDELMALVTDVVVGELVSEEDVMALVKAQGLKELADLADADPATVAAVYNAIEGVAK